ncbi:uncharacterized protein LOC119068966 [Bradysia coprophila]|uniref:uncharacterized protein LOC119068966 n=1 Tax=Bradysia coprophila TaxID=38358 RepID=UPI00187D9B3C|nr:uncharacterized protein LOC119068966 [Bradysia coprophila]
MRTNEETLFRLTSRKFHNMCQQNIRDRKAKRYTSQLETEMAHDREVNFGGTIASPMSATNYMLFIDHRLKHFNSCIALYTQNKYTELAFHKHVHTQKAMDGIVNELLPSSRSHERSLLVIGGTEFNPSAPIKKYRRCPGVRQLVKFVRKRTGCDIVYADEYNTSQVCGRCQRRFKTSDDETIQHKRWERKGARMRLCSNCTPNDNIIPLPTTINTRMSPRAQHLHRLTITNRLFFNVAAYSMEDAKRESDNIHYIAENCCYDMSHDKHTFDPNDRTTQLKCVWNHDISAARNILIKGVASITGIPAPRTLYRQTQINEENSSDESMD